MATIRPAAVTDEEALFQLACAFPTPTPPARDAFAAALRSKACDPAACLLVAEDDTGLVGYVSGYTHDTFYANGPTAWVDEILVAEPIRGHGCGRQLMDAFEHWAARHHCVLVSLATRGAASFYEHLGYAARAAYYKKYLGA